MPVMNRLKQLFHGKKAATLTDADDPHGARNRFREIIDRKMASLPLGSQEYQDLENKRQQVLFGARRRAAQKMQQQPMNAPGQQLFSQPGMMKSLADATDTNYYERRKKR